MSDNSMCPIWVCSNFSIISMYLEGGWKTILLYPCPDMHWKQILNHIKRTRMRALIAINATCKAHHKFR